MDSPTRNVLITSATGHQGSALIRALLSSPNPGPKYHFYAVTRDISAPKATALAALSPTSITLVPGDLNDRAAIEKVFADAASKGTGGIWGVFAVLPYPGLGVSDEKELAQGKILAELALENKVEIFAYSSRVGSGPRFDLERGKKQAKGVIDEYCKDLGKRGLRWTIIRPGFFMENFDDFIGSIAVSVLTTGLKKDTTVGLIASEDIGKVTAAVFNNHEKYLHKDLSLVSECLTMSQVAEAHKVGTGRSIKAVPSSFAWLLLKMNKATQELIKDLELIHHIRTSGAYPEFEEERARANGAYEMRGYAQYVKDGLSAERQGNKDGWNNVSLMKLVTGKL